MKKLLYHILHWLRATREKRQTQQRPIVTREGRCSDVEMLRLLRTHLFDNHNFRFNVLTEQTEWENPGNKQWITVDKRQLNSFTLEAKELGINCWDRDVSRLLLSRKVPDHHPMLDYMSHLPKWDGRDRITPLAYRISHSELWVNGFHRWLLGMTSQWMGQERRCANAIAPVIISTQQGLHKSTFCRMLVPHSLQAYYIDRFDITAQSHFEQRLATSALINMDEFDRYTPSAMASLKNIMQMQSSNFRKMRSERYLSLHRTASFIATSNQRELLSDTTGSRRFLCQEVQQPIDCTPLEHKQLFAQLKHELLRGERSWLNKDEERQWEEHNKIYHRTQPELEAFWQCFRFPEPGEKFERLSAVEIHSVLLHRYPTIMRAIPPRQLSRSLLSAGVRKVHISKGNVFCVVRTE